MALKEPFNSVSHMVGGGLALLGTPLVVLDADGPLAVVAACVYAASLVAAFTMSALYHAIPHPAASRWLFRLDQACIYLLIAGTYTPVALVSVSGAWGWTLFGIQWGLAGAGITMLLAVHRTPQWVHQAAYIVLGWAAVIALPTLLTFPWTALALLVFGGVAYTGGSYLYNRNRPGTWGLGDHELWHLLVLLGAASHFLFMLWHVL